MNLFAPKPRALTIALLLCAPFAQAQDAAPATPTTSRIPAGAIPRLQGDITIDGKLDDAGWAGALEQSIDYEISPGDNTPAQAKTQVRIGYTDDALYVSFKAMDPDPSKIRANLRDRDAMFNDDWVGVFLDTFNDNRRGYELVVNPLGVQGDLIRDETNTNNQEDASWDGLWTSAGQLTADGFDVEIRIPFSTLRFPTGGQDQTWGVSLIRTWPRDKRFQMTSHKVPRDSNCFQCEWGKYTGIAGVKQGRNLEVVPTLTMGTTQSRPAVGTKWGGTDTSIEPGVDVSWAPSPAMTLNATLNPDFSQVETDQLQLDFNSSFALFYQEKRPFFLEGADYFTTQFDVLYTRQIADPDFGLRVTGRTGNEDPSWDGLWSSAGRITAEGYDVEIRIPFSTLRFPRGGGHQKWGISLYRNFPRDKRHQLASHKVPRDSNCFQCEWGKYEGFAGAQQGRNIEVVPTLTVGKPQYRDAANTAWRSGDTSIEPGVDVSWAPSPAMTPCWWWPGSRSPANSSRTTSPRWRDPVRRWNRARGSSGCSVRTATG